jgi:hypothetical protein
VTLAAGSTIAQLKQELATTGGLRKVRDAPIPWERYEVSRWEQPGALGDHELVQAERYSVNLLARRGDRRASLAIGGALWVPGSR